jgi:hypothetical protein
MSAWRPGVFFVVFPSPSGKIPVEYFKLGHDLFIPHPSQFIIHLLSFYSILYHSQALIVEDGPSASLFRVS